MSGHVRVSIDEHWVKAAGAGPSRGRATASCLARLALGALGAILICGLALGGLAMVQEPAAPATPPAAPATVMDAIRATSAALDRYWELQFATHGRAAAWVTPSVSTFTHRRAAITGPCGQTPTEDLAGLYCPVNRHVYVATDLATIDDVIFTLAHEWGHHVRSLLDPAASQAYLDNPVPQELQATCAGGLWAGVETRSGEMTSPEIHDYATRLISSGDKTHGTGRQRRAAFLTGFAGGGPIACGFPLGLSAERFPRLGGPAAGRR